MLKAVASGWLDEAEERIRRLHSLYTWCQAAISRESIMTLTSLAHAQVLSGQSRANNLRHGNGWLEVSAETDIEPPAPRKSARRPAAVLIKNAALCCVSVALRHEG